MQNVRPRRNANAALPHPLAAACPFLSRPVLLHSFSHAITYIIMKKRRKKKKLIMHEPKGTHTQAMNGKPLFFFPYTPYAPVVEGAG